MSKVVTNERKRYPSAIRIPWGGVIGFLGIVFGLGMWALQSLQPSPGEDPNWVPLTEVQTLQTKLSQTTQELTRAQQQNKETQKKLALLQQSHTQLATRLQRTLSLDQVPVPLRGANAQLTAANLQRFWREQQSMNRDSVVALLQVLAHILETGVINTTRPADDANTQTLYRAVQMLLRSVGTYQGQVTGNQEDTYQAVADFQRSRKLKVDGKMGMKTFEAIAERFQSTLRTPPREGEG